MESVVRSNADRLIELQGEKRHEAHLQMFDYFKNRNTGGGDGGRESDGDGDNYGVNDDAEAQNNSVPRSEPIILDYNEESAEGEDHLGLVYSLVLDHAKRRITVVFRGSVTASDWAANRDAFFVTVDNPLFTGKSVGGDSSGGGDDDKGDEVDADGQPWQLILHRGFYEYVYKSIGGEDDDDGDDTKLECQLRQQQTSGDSAQKSEQAASYDAITGQDQQARTKMEEIVAKTKAALDDHPDCEVFTTGVSLGGALTTVFAFFAAACYPELGPITCYSFASPSVYLDLLPGRPFLPAAAMASAPNFSLGRFFMNSSKVSRSTTHGSFILHQTHSPHFFLRPESFQVA